MTYPSNDITPELMPRQQTGTVEIVQGTLIEWDPDTLRNLVEYRDALLENLPVLAPAVSTLGNGNSVLIQVWRPGGPGRLAVYTIIGSAVSLSE